MKKKFLSIISLVVLVSLFTACGASSSTTANNSNAEVEALKQQVADLQQQVVQNQQSTNAQQVAQNQQQVTQQQNQQVGQQQVAQQTQQNQQVNQQTQQNQQVGQQQMGQQFGQQMGMQNVAVSLDEAKRIAVTNAGLDINSVTFVKQMQDWDDGFIKWDVDFVYGDTKYDYDISATNGAILKAERELIGYGIAGGTGLGTGTGVNTGVGTGVGTGTGTGVGTGVSTGVGTGAYGAGAYGGMTGQGIDVESAKQAAVAHAGFNIANVTFVKQKYDFDDGIAKWEIDFVVNTTKYEYEVNAANGAIVKFKMESIYDD